MKKHDSLSSIHASIRIQVVGRVHSATVLLWRVESESGISTDVRGCFATPREVAGRVSSATSMNEEGRDQMKACDESMKACPTTETTRQVLS